MNRVMYDDVIIGSGFGGIVAVMRLTEKGYRVLVLERGKRHAAGSRVAVEHLDSITTNADTGTLTESLHARGVPTC